jgi:hypothetical protein
MRRIEYINWGDCFAVLAMTTSGGVPRNDYL